MSVADQKGARRRMRARYKGAGAVKSISQRIEEERGRAQREAARKKVGKK
ncbi:MAG: hypothetical protein ACHP9V_05860 [Terriglobales bacterium]